MSEKDPKWRFCWQQLNTTDVEAAKQFYGELFGWQFSEQEMAGEMYTIFGMSEDAPLGMFQTQPSDAPSPPLWIPYVSVPDVADTVGKATASGGNVLVPTTAIPDAGTFAVLADPDGAVFAIWATANPDQEQPMPTGNNIPV
ncbi:VOC family protein, partial [bacterium]|nr:VOC family protein [bacterium]